VVSAFNEPDKGLRHRATPGARHKDDAYADRGSLEIKNGTVADSFPGRHFSRAGGNAKAALHRLGHWRELHECVRSTPPYCARDTISLVAHRDSSGSCACRFQRMASRSLRHWLAPVCRWNNKIARFDIPPGSTGSLRQRVSPAAANATGGIANRDTMRRGGLVRVVRVRRYINLRLH